MFIGLFHRCENRFINGVLNTNKLYLICDANKYLPKQKNLSSIINKIQPAEAQRLCNVVGNPYRCDYSSINKIIMSSAIISVCTLCLSIVLIYLHLLINQFKYKTHFTIAVITIFILFVAFVFILSTLILLSLTMSTDLFEYRYNLIYRLTEQSMFKILNLNYMILNSYRLARRNLTNDLEENIRQVAVSDYDIRLDWSAGLEIITFILTTFTIVSQILYLFSTYKNRIG